MSERLRYIILSLMTVGALFFAGLSIAGNWQFGQVLGFNKASNIMFGVTSVMFALISMILPVVVAQFWRHRQPFVSAVTTIIWVLALTYGMLAFLMSPSPSPALSQIQSLGLLGIWGLVQIIAAILPLLVAFLITDQKKYPDIEPVSAPTDNHNRKQSSVINLNQDASPNQHADPVTRFLWACSQAVPGHRVTAKDFHIAYCSWCKNEGIDPHPLHVFGQALAIHGVGKIKSKGRMVYCDISLTSCKQEPPLP